MKSKNRTLDNFISLTTQAVELEDIFESTDDEREYIDHNMALIKRLNFQAKVKLGKMKNERAQSIISVLAQRYNEGTIELKKMLQSIILAHNPQFQFRKLEKLEESDLLDLLGDVELLKKLEDIDEQ